MRTHASMSASLAALRAHVAKRDRDVVAVPLLVVRKDLRIARCGKTRMNAGRNRLADTDVEAPAGPHRGDPLLERGTGRFRHVRVLRAQVLAVRGFLRRQRRGREARNQRDDQYQRESDGGHSGTPNQEVMSRPNGGRALVASRMEVHAERSCLFAGDSGSYPPSAQAAFVFSRKPDMGFHARSNRPERRRRPSGRSRTRTCERRGLGRGAGVRPAYGLLANPPTRQLPDCPNPILQHKTGGIQ